MAFNDISLLQDSNGRFHYSIDENGDLSTDDTFGSEINVSLFTDRRADVSEMEQAEKRRGWEGDQFLNLLDYTIGSKLWLISQSRNTLDTRNTAVRYVENSLQWFISEGYCDRIEVVGERVLPSDLWITSNFYIENNKIKSFTFNLWENTKNAS